MGKKNSRFQQKKHVKKESNFEKLVKQKTQAQKKKIKKAQMFVKESKPQQVQNISDINRKTIKDKIQKKNLFDIESDDEDLQRTQFFSEQNEMYQEVEDEPQEAQDQFKERKSKQAIFKELIKKSKDQKRQRQIQHEKNKDKIEDINEQFKKIQNRLVHTGKEEIKNEIDQSENSYEKLLQQISQDQFVKSDHIQNDNSKQNNIQKQQKKQIKEEQDEEEPINVELKKSDRKNQHVRGILKFNSAFSSLRKAAKQNENNSQSDESSDEENLL